MQPMEFADQAAVEVIREALWRQSGSRAAVMVGAGFSRNARPTSISAREMPSWAQMAVALCDKLYPSGSDARASAMREAASTSGFLRLAQEYRVAFGQGPLNEQIRSLVPDIEYEPGDLHRLLLGLPWNDVHTTNWDSLLERTAREIFDIDYDVVRTFSEIPTSRRPRIIKLHGSFPAHEPFIFTEEDYRTYPTTHAPFVNLVQQSLMESVLCLVGFSGDDPNFLHWSGWVRDNLGLNAPKIYLVGWLGLSHHRRRMLEDRNVVPIDLSRLPVAEAWPSDLRYQYSMEWFLTAIGLRKRYDPKMWPAVATDRNAPPSHLGEFTLPQESLPKAEPEDPRGETGFAPDADQVVEIAEIWNWNRNLYPGWMIAPSSVRDRLWKATLWWIGTITDAESRLHPVQFLFVLDELTWRLETSLAPHFEGVRDAAAATLQRIDIGSRTVTEGGKTQADFKFDWTSAIKAWCRVALVLVSEARFSGEFERAVKLLEQIESFVPPTGSLSDGCKYERLLVLRDSAKFHDLGLAIEKWDTASSDSAWSIRKCGLLASLGNFKETQECLDASLLKTRRHRRRDQIDHGAFSREAWLLWIASTLKLERSMLSGEESYREPIARLQELQTYDCNVLDEYHRIVEELNKGRYQKKPSISEKVNFFGGRTQSFHFGSGLTTEVRRSYEIMRLADFSGLPASIGNVTVLADGLRASAEVLIASERWAGMLWTIRCAKNGSNDDLHTLSRTRIALLPDDAIALGRAYTKAQIESALECDAERYRQYWSNMLPTAIEVFARLILRYRPGRNEEDFDLGLRLLKNDRCLNDFSTHLPLTTLLECLCRVAPTSALIERMPELFAVPIVPRERFPDPRKFWPDDLKWGASDSRLRSSNWTATLDFLLRAAANDDLSTRSSALGRLMIIFRAGILSESERHSLAAIIWRAEVCTEEGWPKGELYPWCYFSLPEQHNGQREAAFRHRFLDIPTYNDFSITVVGTTLHIAEQNEVLFDLKQVEIDRLYVAIDAWATTPITFPTGIFAIFSDPLGGEVDTMKGLLRLLPRIPLSRHIAQNIWTKLTILETRYPNPTLSVYPLLIPALPDRQPAIAKKLREAIVSSDYSVAGGACHAIWQWFSSMKLNDDFPPPPEDLVAEIGNGIARRRPAILEPALQLALLLVTDGPAWARDKIALDLETGLNFLTEEARYDGVLANSDVDIPQIRKWVSHLAGAVTSTYSEAPEVFHHWCDLAEQDPLKEVRIAPLLVNSNGVHD